MPDQTLKSFFSPKGVAIIGASTEPAKLGYVMARNLLRSGYSGAMHYVNPKGGMLFGRSLHKSIKQVPNPVDLAVILIPAPLVPDTLLECTARGVKSAIIATTYNGRVPGPTFRATEGDRVRIRFINGSNHPHSMHFHGFHPGKMDGVPGSGGMAEAGEEFTYEFDAEPFGLHLYHCHAFPLARHIAKGLYGAFIIDPKQGRPPVDHEFVMVISGFDVYFDDTNEFYAVNGIPFYYQNHPIQLCVGETVRIYLVNILEFDLINSFHRHAPFFQYYPTGTSLTATPLVQ